MPLKTNSPQSHRQILEGSPGAPSFQPAHLAGGGGGGHGGVMKTSCYPGSKPQASKEDLVLEKAGVGDRKLALKLDRLDRESKAHMKMREREEKAMRQMCRDIRKHRVFDDTSVGRKADSSSGGNRLLPPIPPHEANPQNIRRVRSTPNSPVNNRKAYSSASPSRTRRPASDALAIPDDGPSLRVRSAGPGLSPAILHLRSRSTSNLPGAAGNSTSSYGTPAITIYPYKEGKKPRSNPDLSDSSPATPTSPTSPTAPSSSKQRAWERGLTPARRARTPAELAKVQGSVSYLTPSAHAKSGLRPFKSDSNLASTGTARSAEDPRFQKLASCLVHKDDARPVSPQDDNPDEQGRVRSSSVDALNQEIVAIRITSSTPTLPHPPEDSGPHPVPPLPGHLKEPGDSLPPLKAHNPRTMSPRILINATVSLADEQGGVFTEETVELNRLSVGGAGPAPKELIALDTGRLYASVSEEDIKSPPFYGKAHNPDW